MFDVFDLVFEILALIGTIFISYFQYWRTVLLDF